MRIKRLIVFVLVIFSFPSVSFADNVYIYGLTSNRKINDSDATLLNSITSKLTNNGHTVRSSYNAKNLDEFNGIGNGWADWIIFVGHGVSCSSRISRLVNGDGLTYPSQLSWQAKGILLFACSVVDIGDFGSDNDAGNYRISNYECLDPIHMKNIEKEYKSKYGESKNFYEIINPAFPDPGLEWERMAKKNNIDYILGFNFAAPLVSDDSGVKTAEGYNLLEKFVEKWISKGIGNEDSFIEAWKSDLSSTQSQDNRDRGYIRCGGRYDNQCTYSLGRKGKWPNVWREDGYKNWEESVWYYGENNIAGEMIINDYRDCLFTGFSNEAEMHARELCLRGVVNGYHEEGKLLFKPDNNINRLEWAKMVRRGAGPMLIPEDEEYQPDFIDYDSKICPKGKDKDDDLCWAYDYIRDLRAKGVVEGFNNVLRPKDNTERSHILKFVVRAFFGEHTDKNCEDYDNIRDFTDAKSPSWFCHYLAAAINCKLIDPSSNNDQQLFPGVSKTKIEPEHEVTRAEMAILVNRARRLKDAGVTNCYP